MTLGLPKELPARIAEHVATWGARDREAGLLLLGRRGQSTADVVAWPDDRGVVRRRGQFALSGIALSRLFDWATDRDLQVRALIHSHGGSAFLSHVDVENGFSVPGFISAVVPNFHRPSDDVCEWGWWRYERGVWVDEAPPQLVSADFADVAFDEDGVR